MRADLHIHTTASDGVLPPDAVVEKAKALGLDCLAVSDHDTMNGLAEASKKAKELGILFIPAIEISAGGEDEIHVLGYGVNTKMEKLSALTKKMHDERIRRGEKMLEKLNEMGFLIGMDDLSVGKDGSLGRPAVARAMVKKGYAQDSHEVFEKYIGRGCPAYVAREKLAVGDVVKLLCEEGALPVLAHPGLIKKDRETVLALIHEWKKCGLRGLEAYHPSHTPQEMTAWDHAARAEGLLVTSGSDFHDENDIHASIGAMTAYWPDCAGDMDALFKELQD